MSDNKNTLYALDAGLAISSPRLSDIHPIYTLLFIMHLIVRGKERKESSNECVGYTTIQTRGCVQHNRSTGTAARREGVRQEWWTN